MIRSFVIAGTVTVFALSGCTRAGSSEKRLDQLGKDIQQIKRKLALLVPDQPAAAGKGPAMARVAAANSPLGRIERRLARMERVMARGGARRRPRKIKRPDPKTVYSVPIAGAPSTGPKNALVTLVKGFEFACPHCMRVAPKLDKLKKQYGDKLRVVYKHYVVHPSRATLPALAACAAGKQGKWEPMYKAIFSKFGRYSQADLDAHAKAIGLDMAKYKADMNGACKARVRRDQMELARVGVRGTPAFFINGHFLGGNQPLANFKRVIDQELKKAEATVARGVSPAKYYDQVVVDRGKKAL